MLRVLTLSSLFPDAGRPGFGGFVARQTQALAAQPGVTVKVVAPVGLPPWPLALHPRYAARRSLPRAETWEGLEVHRPHFPVLPRIADARSAEAMARALLPLLRRLDFDVIDAEFFWPDGVAAVRLGRALDAPVSIKARGSDIDFWGSRPAVAAQMLSAAGQADGLLAVSAALKERMIALGMPTEKIAVHYTGIDAERFGPRDRAAAKAALGVAGPIAITVGALVPVKGQRLAIEALARVPEATLLVVGEGPERSRLEAAAGPYVRFLGRQPHEALPALLGAADVLVHTAEREGLANVWVEALACGTPVVVTDTGAAHEVVDRPALGHVVPRDAEAVAAAIRAILADPPAPETVSAGAARFSWDANGAALAAHLRRLSAERH
jgi:teichuronic acid biosynthesis glycosyltransferase TuaC